MSEYQRFKGIIKKVSLDLECNKLNALKEDFYKLKLIESDIKFEEKYLFDEFQNAFYDKYIITSEDIWEYKVKEEIEPYENYCDLIPTGNGSYQFDTKFYNGGTCESEMIEDALNKLNKQ